MHAFSLLFGRSHRGSISFVRSSLFIRVALGFAGLVPLAQAQRTYNSSLSVTELFSGVSNAPEYHFTPTALALDGNGVLYLADSYNRSIRKLVPGEFATRFDPYFLAANGDHVAAELEGANALAVDSAGNLYAATRHQAYKFLPDGRATVLVDDLSYAQGIAVDVSGNVYIADSNNCVIRKISPTGIETTLAGKVGEIGNANGPGPNARFRFPTGVAVDAGGTVYVVDNSNQLIRKITPDGTVSTLVGSTTNLPRGTGGFGQAGGFSNPWGIAIDLFGILYVTEASGFSYAGYRIHRITPEGAVTTLAISGGFGDVVDAGFLMGIVFDPNGVFYALDGWWGAIVTCAAPPALVKPLAGQSVRPGDAVTLRAEVAGEAPTRFQWMKDGVPMAGATNATLDLGVVGESHLGYYTVKLTNDVGTFVSNPAALTFSSLSLFPYPEVSALTQLSIRATVGPGSRALIVGFAVGGAGTTGGKPLLIRGVGPTLGAKGADGFLGDPMLTIFSGPGVIASNDNWTSNPEVAAIGQQVAAPPLVASVGRDAALYQANVGPGLFTVQLSGVGNTAGVALAEIYDVTQPDAFRSSTPRLINLSARAQVTARADILKADFTLGGTEARTFLLRAVGPGLARFGLVGALVDPQLELFQDGTRLRVNDNWGENEMVASATAKVGAFTLDSAGKDAAMVVTLQPGHYSAQVSGVGNNAGLALVEIYEVP